MSNGKVGAGAGALHVDLIQSALRSGRRPIAFAALFSLVVNGLYLALPIYTQQVFVRVLSSYSAATLLVLTAATIFVFLVSGYLEAQRDRMLDACSAEFDARLSSHVLSCLHEDVAALKQPATSQALRDLDVVRMAISGRVLGVFFDLPWTPIFLIVLTIIDPWVGLVAFIGMVLLVIFALAQDRASRPATREANEAAIRSYAVTDAVLRNSEVVRAMGMLPSLAQRWSQLRDISLKNSLKAAHYSNVWSAAIKFTRMLVQVLIIAVGAYLIIRGDIGPGLLFANMILSSRALAPIERGVSSWGQVLGAALAYGRLKKSLSGYTPATPGTALPPARGELAFEGVNFAISGSLLLTAISFRVKPGEYLGVVGPSGSGKSTLLRLLIGVWKPLNGAVRLDGVSVWDWDRADLGRQIGYMPQDVELFDGTVRDNIARFDPDVTDEEVVAAAQAANAHELIVRLPGGYDTRLGQGGVVLSAGQRQRVGLARALLRQPALIVLDEPNSNLDQPGEQALASALERARARGATIVVVSHKPSLLGGADKMALINNGRLEMFGPRDEVMARLGGGSPPTAAPPAVASPAAGADVSAKPTGSGIKVIRG